VINRSSIASHDRASTGGALPEPVPTPRSMTSTPCAGRSVRSCSTTPRLSDLTPSLLRRAYRSANGIPMGKSMRTLAQGDLSSGGGHRQRSCRRHRHALGAARFGPVLGGAVLDYRRIGMTLRFGSRSEVPPIPPPGAAAIEAGHGGSRPNPAVNRLSMTHG
jgi:hypothetical protein